MKKIYNVRHEITSREISRNGKKLRISITTNTDVGYLVEYPGIIQPNYLTCILKLK